MTKNSEFKKLDYYHRRELILDVACDLFSKTGYDAVTTMELSRAIGCSETMLLSIFPTKTEIYGALFDEWVVLVHKEPVIKLVNDSPLDTLEKYYNDFMAQKYSRDQTMRPNLERALSSRKSDGAKQKMYDVVAASPSFEKHAIEPLMSAGQEKGEIRDGDYKKLTALYWAIVQGSYYTKKDFPRRFKPIPPAVIRNIFAKVD